MNAKKKLFLDRIESIKRTIAKSERCTLESGNRCIGDGFSFAPSVRQQIQGRAKELPPHTKYWVNNVFFFPCFKGKRGGYGRAKRLNRRPSLKRSLPTLF